MTDFSQQSGTDVDVIQQEGTHLVKKRKKTIVTKDNIPDVNKDDRTSVNTTEIENSPFRLVTAEMLIDLPPKAFEDFNQGVYTYINALIMQYVEALDGIVLAYENVRLCDTSGYIYEDSPYCHFFVRANFILWDASKGSKLVGKVIRQSPTHIALLLYQSFNVKIFRQCIPDDVFEWRDDEDFFYAMFTDKQLELDRLYQDGEWFNKRTGKSLTNCSVEFEVLGSEIDEGIVFIVGSLQCYSHKPALIKTDDAPFDLSALLTLGYGVENGKDSLSEEGSSSNNNPYSDLSSV